MYEPRSRSSPMFLTTLHFYASADIKSHKRLLIERLWCLFFVFIVEKTRREKRIDAVKSVLHFRSVSVGHFLIQTSVPSSVHGPSQIKSNHANRSVRQIIQMI